jgi:hypothetical protein
MPPQTLATVEDIGGPVASISSRLDRRREPYLSYLLWLSRTMRPRERRYAGGYERSTGDTG